MEENEIVILRKFLKRQIAECNSTIASMTFKFKDDARVIKKNILRNFARGNLDKYAHTIGNENLQKIYSDIEKKGKDVSPYNYFDLDTLFAYFNYISMIVDGLFTEREINRRIYTTLKDCELVIDKRVPEFFVKNNSTINTGYYNLEKTIIPLKNENGDIMFEKTPDKKFFEKKHPKGECFVLLQKYIHERENSKKKNAPQTVEQTQINFNKKPQTEISENQPQSEIVTNISVKNNAKVNSEQSDSLNIKKQPTNSIENAHENKSSQSQNYIVLKKTKFYVGKEELYLDSQFSPIKYVEGYTENGKSKLYGYIDMSGQIYHGDVYDMQGNLSVSGIDSGVMIFGELETTKFDGMGR